MLEAFRAGALFTRKMSKPCLTMQISENFSSSNIRRTIPPAIIEQKLIDTLRRILNAYDLETVFIGPLDNIQPKFVANLLRER